MSLSYSDIESLVNEGKTPAQIATALAAVTQHKRDIYATKSDSTPKDPDLLFLLISRYEVMELNSSAGWVGPLVDAINSSDSPTLKSGFGKLLTNLQTTDRQVFTNSDDTGATGALVEAIAGIVGGITAAAGTYTQQQVLDGVNALTGGRVYAGVTEQDVQEAITQNDRTLAYNGIAAKCNQASSQAALALEQKLTPEEITAAGVAGWEA